MTCMYLYSLCSPKLFLSDWEVFVLFVKELQQKIDVKHTRIKFGVSNKESGKRWVHEKDQENSSPYILGAQQKSH